MKHRTAMLVIALLVAVVAMLGYMRALARADPVVRRATLVLDGLEGPVTLALLSDIHLGNTSMDIGRLTRIVDQVEALHPDLIAIAGDFIGGEEPGSAARVAPALVEPLSRLRAPLGTVAVLGNHDNWTGAGQVRLALARAGVTVAENGAVTRGPLTIGAVGDAYTGHDDAARTIRAARATGRPWLLLTHSPDIAPALPPDARLVLAGHTHCGQARLFGHTFAPAVSRYGERYRCGIIREGPRTVVVGAGLGTSSMPFRIGAPPDLWLLTLKGR